MKIRKLCVSIGLFGIAALMMMSSGCKSTNSQSTALDATNGVPGGAGGLTVPAAGTTNNAVNKTAVLAAWRELKSTFYEIGTIYTQGPMPPAATDIDKCIRFCPDNWSDLACHYYSHMPSYEKVIPNIRGCFSKVARGGVPKNGQKMSYPDVYDYCVFQDFDAVVPRSPDFDQAIIDANKLAANKPGVMKWIDDNQAAVFKYIMFPDGYPFTWNMAQEQETINEFYKIDLGGMTSYSKDDKAQVDECNAKRAKRPHDPIDGTHCSYTKVTRLNTHP